MASKVSEYDFVIVQHNYYVAPLPNPLHATSAKLQH